MSGRGLSWTLLMGALACAGLLACSNPNFCAGNPDDDCRASWDAATDGPACMSSSECAAPNPVCDTSAGTCVQCLAPGETGACTASTPVCDADHTCRACEAHSECASLTCLPDGACAEPSQVAYVSATGNGTACTLASPCPLLADALAKDLAYVKVAASGAANASSATVIDGESVTIIGEPGATVDRDGDGPILEVRSANADVKVYDLRLTGATSASGVGVLVTPNGGMPALALTRVTVDGNQGGGISSLGGTLTVTRSTVSGNQGLGISATAGTLIVTQSTVSENQGGGISVTGTGMFAIVGNVLFANGSSVGTVGGVAVQVSQNASNRLEFNSFNKNSVQDGLGAAIQCVAGTFTARNNIMSGNGTLSNMNQAGGTCLHTYSIAQPGTVPSGAGNTSDDPLFVNTTTGDLHLQPTSPARGAADPGSALSGIAARDIDGDMRSSPADLGADEAP